MNQNIPKPSELKFCAICKIEYVEPKYIVCRFCWARLKGKILRGELKI